MGSLVRVGCIRCQGCLSWTDTVGTVHGWDFDGGVDMRGNVLWCIEQSMNGADRLCPEDVVHGVEEEVSKLADLLGF